jgi:hypothetical protein
MKVRTLKAMCFGGVRQESGTEVEVPDHLARELIAQGRAVAVGAIKAPTGPMTTESAGVLVQAPAKGKANARS